jgi:hypothetical protein
MSSAVVAVVAEAVAEAAEAVAAEVVAREAAVREVALRRAERRQVSSTLLLVVSSRAGGPQIGLGVFCPRRVDDDFEERPIPGRSSSLLLPGRKGTLWQNRETGSAHCSCSTRRSQSG